MEFLCRTCLKSSQNLLDLFCEDLPHQIEVISSIQILTDDGFPTKICEDCAKNVHFLYDFRKTIVESDATLKAGFILESEQSNPNDDDIVIDEVKLEPFESNDSEATDPFTELANVEKDCPEKIGPRRGYSCKKCDFTTTSYELRRKHHLVHRKVIKVVCNVCGASIRSDNIGKHMSNIHTPSPASCTICEKVFKSKEALGWHMISHQKISLQCTECGKVYTTKKSYRKHLKRHSVADARTEECSICEKRFFTKCVLKSHFRSHTGERPYPCRYCKKGFSSSFALRTHIRQHTNEKPYKCEHCDAAFPQRVSLRTHIKSKHSDKVIVSEQKKD